MSWCVLTSPTIKETGEKLEEERGRPMVIDVKANVNDFLVRDAIIDIKHGYVFTNAR